MRFDLRPQVVLQLQQAKAKADSEALSRRVAEEDIAELEKEKMMIELELKDIGSKHRYIQDRVGEVAFAK